MCNKSIRPVDYKISNSNGVEKAKQIIIDLDGDMDISFKSTSDPLGHWKWWKLEQEGRLVEVDTSNKVNKAIKCFGQWSKFVDPEFHEELKREMKGEIRYTVRTLAKIIIQSLLKT